MKTLILLITALFGIILVGHGQEQKTLSGKFSKVTQECGCAAFGLLSYTENNATTRTYLCFDSEPGDFYEIQSGEEITVSGISKGIICANGTNYKNLYVTSSQLAMRNRQMLVPEFIKTQNKNIPTIKPVITGDLIDFNLNGTKVNVQNLDELNTNSILSQEEQKLYKLIMDYRKQNGLPSIPLSKSLTFVAQTHVRDLEENFIPNTNCNTHSWSDKGNWSSCCYTSDHKQNTCMWNKPRELTSYQGTGYEISFGGLKGYTVTAESALKSWQGSNGHNQVIINAGTWKDNWKAIGIGIYKGYATVWFGKVEDK